VAAGGIVNAARGSNHPPAFRTCHLRFHNEISSSARLGRGQR
jgi:hypothetical protein